MNGATVRISDLCDLISESVRPGERPDALYLGLEHLASGRLVRIGGGQASEMRSNTSAFQAGDVLYGKLRPYLDKAVLADEAGVCTTELLVLRANADVDPRFLAAVVHSPAFLDYAVAGTTGVQHPRTSWAHIREFRASSFSYDEQQEIADLLWLVHEAISRSEALIQEGQALKRAAMQTLFTRGLRGEAQKQTEIGPVPESWEVVRIGDQDVAEVILGQSPPSSAYNQTGDGLPFFQGKVDFGLTYPTPRIWCDAGRKFARNGDILLSVRAPVGDVNIATGDCVIGRGISAVRPGPKSNPWFLYFALQHIRHILESRSTGSTFASVNKTTLNNLPIPFPGKTEQNQIGEVLYMIDCKIDLHLRKRAVLDELFKALLHKLMTGEMQVGELGMAASTVACEPLNIIPNLD